MFREGIQSDDLSKIKYKCQRQKKSGVDKENKVNDIYKNKYRIALDYEILKDRGVFFPRALSDALVFELGLAPARNIVIGSEKALLAYELTYIEPEYEVIHSQELADEARSNYTNGKRFMYDYVPHLKTILIARATDRIINEKRRLVENSTGIVMLVVLLQTCYAGDIANTLSAGNFQLY